MPRQILLSVLIGVLASGGCGSSGGGIDAIGRAQLRSSQESVPGSAAMLLSSPAVIDGRLLPAYRCEPKVHGVEASIPLDWSGIPEGTGSLAIVMHHVPNPDDRSRVSSYLLLWGIDPSVVAIPHGEAAGGPWFMGSNKDGTAISYTSPCSKGPGAHEYTITLYALSETPPSLPGRSSVDVTFGMLTNAIATVRVLGTATLTFTDTTP